MDKEEIVAISLIAFFIIILITVLVLVKSHFEMKSFNKHSETKATLVDAIFSELRVNTK